LKIDTLEIGKSRIKVKIKNERCCSKAINVKVEMCVVDSNGDTYHLHIDKSFDSFDEMVKNEKHIFRVTASAQNRRDP
jgi:hypothetical protein